MSTSIGKDSEEAILENEVLQVDGKPLVEKIDIPKMLRTSRIQNYTDFKAGKSIGNVLVPYIMLLEMMTIEREHLGSYLGQIEALKKE